ncbi:MAG: helix-turn-helix domain-containing protein [Acidobacteria bacterium]|jgi:excisionase family DNA binding protein|nr:helix-turn-helix domain-containing protein [Acidobacteriota bacterium]
MSVKDYLTTGEAAAALGMTDGRVRQLIRAGVLPALIFGRDYMIKRSDLRKAEPQTKRGRPRRDSESQKGTKK